MSYADMYALAYTHLDFRGRISMCVAEQAKVFVNDERPEFKDLASAAIADNREVTERFLPLVATQPGMSADSTDEDLLAAVQYLWPLIGVGFESPA